MIGRGIVRLATIGCLDQADLDGAGSFPMPRACRLDLAAVVSRLQKHSRKLGLCKRKVRRKKTHKKFRIFCRRTYFTGEEKQMLHGTLV